MLSKLFNAKSTNDIKELIGLLESRYETEWIPVGNNESNHSTFQMLERGENGIIERLTNAIDAVIEKEYYLNPDPSIKNPRESSVKYFKIKDGNLSNYKTKEIPDNLKRLVELNVLESNKKSRPTIEVRDHGIGLTASEFGKTILSLQGGNKLKKFYLAGTFGQGGSTANIFSKHTLFISKAIPEKNGTNEIAFTITKEFDEPDYKTPIHKYLVLKSTGYPITVKDEKNLFNPGTLVRHIEMNINQYGKSSAKAPGDHSIYHLVNKKLFNPILPIRITENRIEVDRTNIERNNNSIVALGCNSRLKNNENVKCDDKIVTDFIFGGSVVINYWIIENKETYKNYNEKSTPVLYTINGQVEGNETSNFFDKIAKPYLLNHLIVNVDCDYLEDRVKARLFTSDRAKFQNNDSSSKLREKVIDILSNDPKLIEFNRYFKEQMLSESSEKMSDELNRKIENKLKLFLNSGGIGKVSKEDTENIPHNPNKPVGPYDIPELFDFPTFVKITNREYSELPINKDLVLNYISNANHEKFEMEDNIGIYIEKENSLILDGYKFYKNGHGIINFKLSPEIQVGDEIFVKIYIKGYDDDENLSSSIMVKVVDKEVKEEKEEKTPQTPRINTISVFKDSAEYNEFFSDDIELPCELKDSEDSIDIFINMENKSLRKLQENIVKEDNTNTLKILNDEYIKQIAYYALILHINEKNKKDDERLDPKIKSNELKRVAILISGMINDNLKIYITESKEENGIEIEDTTE